MPHVFLRFGGSFLSSKRKKSEARHSSLKLADGPAAIQIFGYRNLVYFVVEIFVPPEKLSTASTAGRESNVKGLVIDDAIGLICCQFGNQVEYLKINPPVSVMFVLLIEANT